MVKYLSRTVALSAIFMATYVFPVRSATIDLSIGSDYQYFDFGNTGSSLPTFSFNLSGPGEFRIVDAYQSGDQFRLNITSSTGSTVFSGLTSAPSVGSFTTDPVAAFKNPAFSSAQISLSAGTYTATGTVAASPFFSGGAFAGLFASSGGGGGGAGGSGGVPTPEVNAGLGLLLAGATFAFLRRKRGARHEATVA